MRRILALAVALSLAACGTDATVDAGQAPDPPFPGHPVEPPVTAVDPTLDELGLVLPHDCPQPFDPVHAAAEVYGGEPVAVGVRAPEGESLDVLARRFAAPDTDGDGAPDEVATEGERLVVRRVAGEVVLARPDGVVGSPGGMTWIGDLDADGRDEVVAYASVPGGLGALETYVVPGTVVAGTHDPGDVGILLPWEPNTLLWAVGDHDGDGAQDVLVPGPAGPMVVAGIDLVGPGPGGVLEEPLRALRDAPPEVLGVLELAAGVPPVFVTATDAGGDGATRIRVVLHTDPQVVLRIGGLEPIGGGWGATGGASGYRSGGDRIAIYGFNGGRSGYGGTWYWNLDDPCAGFAPPPAGDPTVIDPRATPATGVLPATG